MPTDFHMGSGERCPSELQPARASRLLAGAGAPGFCGSTWPHTGTPAVSQELEQSCSPRRGNIGTSHRGGRCAVGGAPSLVWLTTRLVWLTILYRAQWRSLRGGMRGDYIAVAALRGRLLSHTLHRGGLCRRGGSAPVVVASHAHARTTSRDGRTHDSAPIRCELVSEPRTGVRGRCRAGLQGTLHQPVARIRPRPWPYIAPPGRAPPLPTPPSGRPRKAFAAAPCRSAIRI